MNRHRKVLVAVSVQVSHRTGPGIVNGQAGGAAGVEPLGRAPQNADGLVDAFGSPGCFAPSGSGQSEVGQHQIGLPVAVEVTGANVGGVGSDPGPGFSPALPGISADEVDFALIGAHQQVDAGVAVGIGGREAQAVIAGERHLLTGQVPGRPRRGLASDHLHQSAAAQKGHFLEPVAVEVAGSQVQGLGNAQLGRVRQEKPLRAPPEGSQDVSLGLTGKPGGLVEGDDVRPLVPVQVCRGHGQGAVDRQLAMASPIGPAVLGSPQNGEQSPRVLKAAAVGAEDGVQVAIPVQILQDHPEAALHRQLGPANPA